MKLKARREPAMKLTQDEIQFLLQIISSVQYGGSKDDIKRIARLLDSIEKKLMDELNQDPNEDEGDD